MRSDIDTIRQRYIKAAAINDGATLEQCVIEFSSLGTPLAEPWAELSRGIIHLLHGDFLKAATQFRSTLDSEQVDTDAELHGRLYNGLGICNLSMGKDDALDCFHVAYEIFRRAANAIGMARSQSNIGIVYNNRGDFVTSLEYFTKAVDMYGNTDDVNGLANSTSNIGNAYAGMGEYASALPHYYKALEIMERTGDKHNAARVMSNIGRTYSDMNDLAKAEHFLLASKENYRKLGARSGEANSIGQLATAYSINGKRELAVSLHREALAIYESTGERQLVTMTKTNLCSDLLGIGLFDEASAILLELEQGPDTTADHRTVQMRCRASILKSRNDYHGAIEVLHRAVELATTNHLRTQTPGLYLQLRDLYKEVGDFDGYIKYNELHQTTRDEITGAEQQRRFALADAERRLEEERSHHKKQLDVLYATLPQYVAERVARGEVVKDLFENAAVLFLDVVGFTTHSENLEAGTVVELLQKMFTTFDTICAANEVTKIKTIGDSYMAVAFGTANAEQRTANVMPSVVEAQRTPSVMPSEACPAEGRIEAQRIANVARAMMSRVFTWPHTGERVMFRIGIHCGPVVAGVLGTERMQYDVWGDTVNVASRMESTSEPGKIHVSEALAAVLNEHKNSPPDPLSHASLERGSYTVVSRGMVDVKGKGMMQTYWLE